MAFENKPLKSQWEIAAEKTGVKKKEIVPVKEEPKKTFLEEKWAKIEQQKAELKAAEAKINMDDAEKLKGLQGVLGDLSKSISQKEENILPAEAVVQEEAPAAQDSAGPEVAAAIEEAPIAAEESVAENPQTLAEEIPVGVEELLQSEPANNVEALGGVDEAGSVEWHKDQLRQYLEDPVVAKELTPQEMQGFKDSFSEEIDNNPDAGAMEAAMSNRVDDINNFINEKRRQTKGVGEKNVEVANNTEALAETQQAEEEPIIKEEVQTEALKDFTNELKGIRKNEQWKEDPIMQGMEEFANSFKEKTPMTETLKDMFSFIKKKGAEINSGRLTAKKAIGEFSKKSSEWAKKIFGGAEIGQSDEALRIDELASGGDRSIGAIKVDQAMDRAREAGKKEKMADFESKISLVTNMNDLLDLMAKVDGFQGSEEFYSSKDQSEKVKTLFETNDKNILKSITRANGLRSNVKRVYTLMKNQQDKFMKEAA